MYTYTNNLTLRMTNHSLFWKCCHIKKFLTKNIVLILFIVPIYFCVQSFRKNVPRTIAGKQNRDKIIKSYNIFYVLCILFFFFSVMIHRIKLNEYKGQS